MGQWLRRARIAWTENRESPSRGDGKDKPVWAYKRDVLA